MEDYFMKNWEGLLSGIVILLVEYRIFKPLKSKYEEPQPQPKQEDHQSYGELSIEKVVVGVVTGRPNRIINSWEVVGFIFSSVRWAFLCGIIGVISLFILTLVFLGIGSSVSGTVESIPQYFTLGAVIGFISRFIKPIISIVLGLTQLTEG